MSIIEFCLGIVQIITGSILLYAGLRKDYIRIKFINIFGRCFFIIFVIIPMFYSAYKLFF